MYSIGANAIIIQDGKVLLAQREDYEVWCLPGGHLDGGETLPAAAIREAKEETGLDIELERLVGIYARGGDNQGFMHVAAFAGRVVGGTLARQIEEIIDLAWFEPDALPSAMFWWHRQQVADAFAGVGGSSAWHTTFTPTDEVNSRQELYALRDASGLSRVDFYTHYYESNGFKHVNELGSNKRDS